MTTTVHENSKYSNLGGARIWLSGAVPEDSESTEEERNSILEFVREFSSMVFRAGGSILHGAHPSFTPLLLSCAEKYQTSGGRKDCLTLAVSRFFSENSSASPIDEWRKRCVVFETPKVTGDNSLQDSLTTLRQWMAERCDAMVVVGGKRWRDAPARAGVPIEVQFGIGRGVPCFLVGALGGATKDLISTPEGLYRQLKNGLSEQDNGVLATTRNAAEVSGKIFQQLMRLPLVRGKGVDGTSFRILALDGGGIKGAFTASVLAVWERQTNLKIVDHFDLIAGTSTGGILALGLGAGLSAKEMLSFYKTRGPVIFPVTSMASKIKHSIRHLVRPKYSQQTLLKELRAAYREADKPIYLKNSRCRLLIPTCHALTGKSHSFRTPHHPDLTLDGELQLSQVALATAAAPTYFAAAKISDSFVESQYFDGGVWANSPALTAIVEAVCYLGVPIDRIDVLSVGTTESPDTLRKQTKSGIAGWGMKLARFLMNVQEESSIRHAELLAGAPRFFRVNVVAPPSIYELDGTKEIDELIDLGANTAMQSSVISTVKSRFLNGVMAEPWARYSA